MYFLTWTCICCILLTSFSCCLLNREYPEKHVSLASSGDLTLSENASYTLPTSLKPSGYDLSLLPFLDNSTFKGWETITFDVITSTSVIILHMDTEYIPLDSMVVSVVSATQAVTIVNSSADTITQMATFTLNDTLMQQQGVIMQISYEGRMCGSCMQGFYVSTYKSGSINHNMGITQFESTFARRAFPCFDEPAYRAKFTINLYRSSNQTSMSNMPLSSSNYDNATGMMLDSYETSPPMSTYLVAFSVSDLGSKSDNRTMRVFTRESAIQDTAYVVAIGQPILDSIANILNVSYPLPKMDVVAVPDFAAGAMENWGLTTFREKYVLFDPVKNSWRDKFNVLSVVAHEFGHQWFGDLVTPEWWDYAWLNEAFATYFEYTIPDVTEPGWELGSAIYVMDALQYALSCDVGNPRPMTSPVSTPDQIENVFDYVIYEKGGSILRMTEHFLTTPVWRAGLNKYLNYNAYKTGTPDELFFALQDAASKISMTVNVTETLQGWTTQAGYPLITMTLVNSTSNSSIYNITQAPYSLSDSYSNQTWTVPITCTSQSESMFDPTMAQIHWLDPSDSTTSQLMVNGSGWVICNIDQVGFYRVNYDSNNWDKLKTQLDSNHSAIYSAINRGQILDDGFHLARTGHISYSVAFGLSEYLRKETAVVPLNAFIKHMRYLLNMFPGTATGDGLKKYSQDVMADIFDAMTANMTQALSTSPEGYKFWIVSSFACEVDIDKCKRLASEIFNLWLKNTSDYVIPAEVKQPVICTGLRMDSSESTFMSVMDYYLNSDNAAEKFAVMNAMGCLNNEVTINLYLEIVCDVNASHIRPQDRWIAFRALASQQTGIAPVLRYMCSSYDKMSKAMTDKDIQRVMATIANTISQQSHISQVLSILNDNTVDPRFRTMLNITVLPAMNKHMSWVSSASGSDLKAWVDAYIKSSAVVSFTALNVLLTLVPVVFMVLNY